jgi:hypothetical protein
MFYETAEYFFNYCTEYHHHNPTINTKTTFYLSPAIGPNWVYFKQKLKVSEEFVKKVTKNEGLKI